MGGGGVDGAIHRAGGPAILEACKKIRARSGPLPNGRAVATTGGRLPAKQVIHTVGPVWNGGNHGEPETLASCYRESIRVADEIGATSIAFPSISTGAFGYPVGEAAAVAVLAVAEALQASRTLRDARFVLVGENAIRAYEGAAYDWAGSKSHIILEQN
jgi:O-acetyl-ADP-ribose deacetylase (regulator of RNase III)